MLITLLPHEKLTELQRVQLEYTKSLLEGYVIPLLCNPKNLDKLREILNDAEAFYFGIKGEETLLSSIGSHLLIFNRFFIASTGPRIGDFLEKVIELVLKKNNLQVWRNININSFELFKEYASSKERRNIDFIVKKDKELYLIELRTSEHTGGRTSQESLLDKFKIVLNWILSKGYQNLLSFNVCKINLTIAILYSERNYRILNREYMNESRLKSLVSYILQEDQVFGRLDNLVKQKGFRPNYNDKDDFKEKLMSGKEILVSSNNFSISFNIYLGEEFFTKILGIKYEEFKEQILREVGEDLKILYSIIPYEIRLYLSGEEGNLMRIYNIVKNECKKDYEELIDLMEKDPNPDQILKRKVNEIANKIIEKVKGLKVMEEGDLNKQFEIFVDYVKASLIIMKLGCREKMTGKES